MDKKNNILWSLSLLLISIVTIVLAVCNLAGVDLPDMAIRILGIVDICAVPILVYTSIKKVKR